MAAGAFWIALDVLTEVVDEEAQERALGFCLEDEVFLGHGVPLFSGVGFGETMPSERVSPVGRERVLVRVSLGVW